LGAEENSTVVQLILFVCAAILLLLQLDEGTESLRCFIGEVFAPGAEIAIDKSKLVFL